MTTRKTREARTVATEDAFGTPPVARGSMMNVAGASDEDQDLPLITDDELAEGLLRTYIQEVIKKSGGKYVLYTKHKKGGKRRKLGTHSSKASAERQEKAIHAHGG